MKALAVLGAFVAGATLVDSPAKGLFAIASCLVVAVLIAGVEHD